MNALGHINACLGLAQELKVRGHRVVWAIDRSFKGKLNAYDFEEELVGKEVDLSSDDKEYWQRLTKEHNQTLKESALVVIKELILLAFAIMYRHFIISMFWP